jgi:hypothetical protein
MVCGSAARRAWVFFNEADPGETSHRASQERRLAGEALEPTQHRLGNDERPSIDQSLGASAELAKTHATWMTARTDN